jgi:hypothetical protein
MKLDSETIDATLSFETHAGVKYNHLKFTGLIDAATMLALGQDPVGLHLQNKPYLPDPKPEAYTDYKYAMFVGADKQRVYLGVPWVREDSIVNNGQPNYIMTIIAPTPAQLDTLRSMAVASGIENFTLKAV